MLNIIDGLRNSNLPTNFTLVGLKIVNLFSSIDNESALRTVKFPPTSFVLDAFEPYLSCNNSVFDKTNYSHTNGRAEGLHMFSLALVSCDSKAVASDPKYRSRKMEKFSH